MSHPSSALRSGNTNHPKDHAVFFLEVKQLIMDSSLEFEGASNNHSEKKKCGTSAGTWLDSSP
jgi:hypothetical protein